MKMSRCLEEEKSETLDPWVENKITVGNIGSSWGLWICCQDILLQGYHFLNAPAPEMARMGNKTKIVPLSPELRNAQIVAKAVNKTETRWSQAPSKVSFTESPL